MAKGRKLDWWDLENAEEIIYVSKSEIKRDAEALKKIGEKLVNLTPAKLAQIPLTEEILEAVQQAQKFTKEARRRQLQYLGKLLRNGEIEPITTALAKLENTHQAHKAMLHKIEEQRDLLIASDDALTSLLNKYPSIEVQPLRGLIRGARKEQAIGKFGKNYREIYALLKLQMLSDEE